MKAPARRTLRAPATLAGRGLFTGAPAEVTILPRSEPGIVFRRADLPGAPPVPALASHVGSDPRLPGRNTILSLDPSRAPGADNPSVLTVEHVMSALAGLGVTDADVRLSAPELPISDGSALDFCRVVAAAGTTDAGAVDPIVVTERLVVRDERAGAEIVADPPEGRGGSPGLVLSYTLEYSAGGPARQTFACTLDPATYARDVAPARTFCLRREAEALRAAGLFAWVTPRDMLVLDESGSPIDNALRFPDEPARHKLLDLLGDLALAGAPIVGRISATRSGHALNAAMARLLLARRTPPRA